MYLEKEENSEPVATGAVSPFSHFSWQYEESSGADNYCYLQFDHKEIGKALGVE